MRIVYMGTGEIGIPAFTSLIDHPDHEVVGVFTQPDKKVGRKQLLTPPEIKVLAEKAGIPVFQPETLQESRSARVTPGTGGGSLCSHGLRADPAKGRDRVS